MKKPEISFRVIDGSGPLSVYWHKGPYGDALECKEGTGVVWLSPGGELLGVEFDDVNEKSDKQILTLPDDTFVEVAVKKAKVSIQIHHPAAVH